ncbi:hypothetical protein [Mycobacterium sp. URHD0025]|uniref:hypothetical protein n=1 Tax=Mycobacterium sp. URHD0025 TaxID=1298864 RepID=UPI0012DD763C|nr:hypothetical protein [Mycobacterium sp. URHD0025]
MSGFGNEMGAMFGGEMTSSYTPRWNESEWNTLMGGRHQPDSQDGELKDQTVNAIPDVSISKETTPPDTSKLGEIKGLDSDQTVADQVTAATTGGKKINWESWTFKELREEAAGLKLKEIGDLATAWTTHGTNLKEHSETFKDKVGNAITGKWSGDSATAAEAASKQVTKTSIYDFTPSSEEISDRLGVLKEAFSTVQGDFPKYADHKLIDDFDTYDKKKLDDKAHEFNTKYHFDEGNHLRLANGQYVDVNTAVDEKHRIEQSIRDYQDAVHLFSGTYQPAIEAVAQNFPNLPPLPNMKFEAPTGPGGPGGPGGTTPYTPGSGGGGGGPKIDTPKFDPSSIDKPKIDTPKIDKPTGLDPNKPGDQNSTTDPTKDALDSLTDPVKSAIDSATGAAKDAAGQLADAMKNAAGQNPLGQGLQGPPEGVLGLGPQGLGGAGAGKGAGGAGGGVPLRGLPSGLPTGTPATAAAKMPASAAGAGAGLGAGAGSPGAGAPAAGQRAGDQNGKGHQVNKALRRKKNGKDVIGDAEASVPVVGADEEAAQTESVPVDQPESRRRIPQRGTTWQPDSAVQPGPVRPARGSQVTPGRSE